LARLPAPAGGAPRPERRARARVAWEDLLDGVIARGGETPAADEARRMREAFGGLDAGDRMDGIRRALHLLPDERFAALDAILFDASQDREVLDAIFDDALNRAGTLKLPLLRRLAADQGHPLAAESARLLDMTGTREQPPEAAP
jgi:hypothetical protein